MEKLTFENIDKKLKTKVFNRFLIIKLPFNRIIHRKIV